MRLFALIFGVALLLSMGVGGAVHAAERLCDGATFSQLEHQEGKSSDSDKDAPHAHGCHGHHVASPGTASEGLLVAIARARLSSQSDFHLPETRAGPELRPPQA
ncbi:MAG: hypothetical protein CMN73_00915 [Sphingomonas sp.]|nr:hypothetical protein [Sphingomonas sp.]|tara:strand:+ start:1059 stop:1370 length:312 start_codon:yes stop_codon:yes gene_type:complete